MTRVNYLIIISIAVVALFIGIKVQMVYSSKLMVEVPTYDVDNLPITGPNGTTFIELEHEDDTILRDFPFVNDTTTINIEEYEVCVSKRDAQDLESSRNMGLNTLDPFIIETLKNISMISMQNCIYQNSANQ